MSERENFISRWSRRKKAADAEAQTIAPPVPQTQDTSAGKGEVDCRERSDRQSDGGQRQEFPVHPVEPSAKLAFDVTRLPPIESITAETDIRAFLAPGVPPELTRAALRRAWTVDPAIRDFIGLSENSWDFNAPDTIAGFGPLEMTDEMRRQVARFVGRSIAGTAEDAVPPSQEAKETPSPIEKSVLSDATGCTGPSMQDAAKPREHDRAALTSAEAPQPTTERKPATDHVPAKTSRRSHGGALPQ
jgi:hypothetical protein